MISVFCLPGTSLEKVSATGHSSFLLSWHQFKQRKESRTQPRVQESWGSHCLHGAFGRIVYQAHSFLRYLTDLPEENTNNSADPLWAVNLCTKSMSLSDLSADHVALWFLVWFPGFVLRRRVWKWWVVADLTRLHSLPLLFDISFSSSIFRELSVWTDPILLFWTLDKIRQHRTPWERLQGRKDFVHQFNYCWAALWRLHVSLPCFVSCPWAKFFVFTFYYLISFVEVRPTSGLSGRTLSLHWL